MAINILFWSLCFALGYLLFTSIILIRNRIDLTPLLLPDREAREEPKISVCVPARNEEKNLPELLHSLVRQSYTNYKIFVLDDHSEDNTPNILKSFQKEHPELLTVLQGEAKPDDWLGKPWACQQLGRAAGGDILLFLDADTVLQPVALKGVAEAFRTYGTDMITVWPHQKLGTFWEKSVIPLIYYGLVTILPAIYVYRKPRWMPGFLYRKFSALFAAANGQCVAFLKESYRAIGGHASVKAEIVEDVQLAKNVKKSGMKLRMFHGVGTVSCRMYSSNGEMFEGLRKNFLAGFNHSIPLFILAALLHIIVFLVPLAGLVWSLIVYAPFIFYLSSACITLILLHRLVLAFWLKWDPIYSFTHPLGVLWFQWLGIIKLLDHFTGRKTKWKGRNV
jgi:chlorobactene glucosyltransferase